MTNNKPIDVYLIAGFLGAGKTTFLRQMMLQLGDRKLGLIVNEFGSISIDAPLLIDDEIQLVEINDGSVFCACLSAGFTKTLKAFSEQPIDILLIESSGMADPSNMLKTIKDMEPYLKRPFNYRGLITLVDSTNVLRYIKTLLPLQNQIAAADLILVNKVDLVDQEQLKEIHVAIGEYQKDVPVVDTEYGGISLEQIRELLHSRGHVSPSFNTPENRPESWVLHIKELQNQADLESFCHELEEVAWRIKGFTKNTKDSWLHIDSTGKHVSVKDLTGEPPESFEIGRIVIIGPEQSDDKFKKQIELAWQKTAQGDIDLTY